MVDACSSQVKSEGKIITFRYSDCYAQKVYLSGTMNEWNPSSTPLYRDEQGNWGLYLRLKPGRYEYKFIVDGQWTADPENRKVCPDGYGGLNSVLIIPKLSKIKKSFH